jgi:hypothetical protein
MSDEGKDYGKYPLQPSELTSVLGPTEVPKLTTDSGMMALKGLVDRLFREVQQLELRKQEVLVQLVAVNQALQNRVNEQEIEDLKARKRNDRHRPISTNGSGSAKKH